MTKEVTDAMRAALSTPTTDDDKWTRDFKAARNFYGSRDDLVDGVKRRRMPKAERGGRTV